MLVSALQHAVLPGNRLGATPRSALDTMSGRERTMSTEPTVTDRLVAFLEENGADFTVMTHEAVSTSEDAARVRGTPLEQGAKALVFRADGRPVLLVLPAHR